MQRRRFIKHFSAGGALLATGSFPVEALAAQELFKLTILHTNDVHSRVDPFPMDGSRLQGLGGAERRAAMIRNIRDEGQRVLLFDSGDIFQGTPYFNVFEGEIEFRLMTAMRYDASTIGNHDFDAGIDGLVRQLPHADFPFVICNYDFAETPMAGRSVPYKVFTAGDIRVGVTGVGIELQGLVPKDLYGETRYNDPIAPANRYAAILRHDERCDLVICLSHIGYRYRGDKVSDIVLARNSRDIDIILGGHTHTFMDEPDMQRNLDGRPVMINQVGWAGVRLGRIDFTFERNRKNRCVSCDNLWIRS